MPFVRALSLIGQFILPMSPERSPAEAITLAWNWIEKAVNERCPDALNDMAKASYLAGRAINITKTTAPHAVSYPMTSYFGITHGHAVGLLTTRFLPFNEAVTELDCLDARGPDWVKKTAT